MSNAANKLIQAAAGNAGEAVYVDDVFSTYLYDGTGSSLEINNGMDLSGEGGLVWIKGRTQNSATQDHRLVDTERGVNEAISSSTNDNVLNITGEFTSFDNDGFTLASTSGNGLNRSGEKYVSWTFRNQPGFFEVVKYEGNGTAGRTVSHNLGSAPGCIIVKRVESGQSNGDFFVYHRGNTAAPETDYILLNGRGASVDSASAWNDTAPTATEFTLGSSSDVNASSNTYIAYLFAHDDQSFGEDSDEAIIKCGNYTGDGTNDHFINVGFEPQFLFVRGTDYGFNLDWNMSDAMRGLSVAEDEVIFANSSAAESGQDIAQAESTGFRITDSDDKYNASGINYIYIAVRRPNKPASEFATTDLFDDFAYTDNALNQSTNPILLTADGQTSGPSALTDMWWHRLRSTGISDSFFIGSRLTGPSKGVVTSSTGADPQGDAGELKGFDQMTGVEVGPNGTFYYSSGAAGNRTHISYYLRRAPGFLDVVTYTGTGSSGATFSHNLGVAPEFIMFKRRTGGTNYWEAYHSSLGATKHINPNADLAARTSSARFNDTAPTASVFTLGDDSNVNASSSTYIAYLFATVDGISKVGSYSGTGSDVNVDCGFSSGARFILIKRSDSTGDWYVWDSARGIVAGNDPYVLMNTNAAETTGTDYIDPLSSGFTVTSSASAELNASGGTYIFLAIA